MKNCRPWLPVVLWALVIFYLSGIPGLTSGLPCDFILRKLAHVMEYFFLTFLLYRAVEKTFKLEGIRLSLALATAVFVYAATDEIHQLFVPGRHGTLRDVLIDQLGALLFLAGFHLALRLPALRSATSRLVKSFTFRADSIR